MRGTGSKDVVLDRVFVPEHRAVRMSDAWVGTVPDVEIPLYRLPVGATLATMLVGSIVGMSERGLQLFIDETRTRTDAYTGEPKVLSVGLQGRVGGPRAEIADMWTLANLNCDLLEEAMRHDPPMPTAARAQARWNAAYAAELCRRAAERAVRGAGARAAYDGNVLQTASGTSRPRPTTPCSTSTPRSRCRERCSSGSSKPTPHLPSSSVDQRLALDVLRMTAAQRAPSTPPRRSPRPPGSRLHAAFSPRLELKRAEGSSREAPLKKVTFTMFL